jgi:hypothetical protein
MFKIFNKHNLTIILSEKKDGPMSSPGFLVGEFDNKEIVLNRERFFKKIGIAPESVVTVGSLHNNNVVAARKDDAGKALKNVDGLLTQEKGLFLSLSVADCLPVYLFDPKSQVVGLLHCGWKGIVKNILEEGIKKMVKEFGSSPENILAGIGPGISKCHFEAGGEVAKKLDSSEGFIDLKGLVKEKLLTIGLRQENIEICLDCTFCLNQKYFSYRRDRPTGPQTMVAVIGMKIS